MIIKIVQMPKNREWGIFYIDNLADTYFRFEFVNGKPRLDKNFFADKEENPDKKHKKLSVDLYDKVQKALVEHIES
ncbi:hypothetical protein G3M81_23265 [Bacillus paralicheniformis]|uniref:hypothetical protein n=1 Tax=Bacillus TaxID=1386 RepID=UPI0013EEBC1D|nr:MULTISPECIES: hypothetical protein [Bacillus]QII26916.1 hypothetical protein G3M80_20680 [Bacillus altitudinis]QII51481.1 hypothetical protein G3M81_23265 [Bacillus paralicheniformis]